MQNRRVANEAKWTSGIDTGRIIANEIILVFIPIVVLAICIFKRSANSIKY